MKQRPWQHCLFLSKILVYPCAEQELFAKQVEPAPLQFIVLSVSVNDHQSQKVHWLWWLCHLECQVMSLFSFTNTVFAGLLPEPLRGCKTPIWLNSTDGDYLLKYSYLTLESHQTMSTCNSRKIFFFHIPVYKLY